MLSRSHGVSAPSQETSYQAQGSESSCACSSKPYGLTTTCIEHSPHVCPGRVNAADGALIPCGGMLVVVRAAVQLDAWSETPAVLSCSRCSTRVAVLLTLKRRLSNALARFNGPCPSCKRPLLVDDARPQEGEHAVIGDSRFHQAAFHAVPACADFLRWDLVDVCLHTMGVPPSRVSHG